MQQCKIERSGQNYWSIGYTRTHLSGFGKSRFLSIFADILNFYIKHIKASRKLYKIERFGPNFCSTGHMEGHLAHFPAIFGDHFEYLHKNQKCMHLGNNVRRSNFNQIFGPQGIYRVIWHLVSKMAFPPLSAAILNLCIKFKNTFFLGSNAR